MSKVIDSSLKNPFKDELPKKGSAVDYVAKVLGKEEAEVMKKALKGYSEGQEDKVEEGWTKPQLSEEDQAQIEKIEKGENWTREQYIEWAKSFGKDEDWIKETFTFRKDGTTVVEGNLEIRNLNLDHLPKGIKEIEGYLDLGHNKISKIENLPEKITGNLDLSDNLIKEIENMPETISGSLFLSNNPLNDLENLRGISIKGYLYLGDIPATVIPDNIYLEGSIILLPSQKALIQNARRKGYKVDVQY